jgi:transposase
MLRRHALSDEQWERIKDLLPGRPGTPGRPASDNRLFVDAVLWIGKTGAPWRDLPERFGDWNSAWRRFDRWARQGVWEAVFDALQDPDLEWAHPRFQCHPRPPPRRWRQKKANGTGGQEDEALGRSRGGFGTKIHGSRRERAWPAGVGCAC